ncbi:hypothetical protein HYW75_05885 [Candidatus Pacearchaeota archaeon]|nr:hypothetical protein [Candidatus Pacearchaeota archaeon]
MKLFNKNTNKGAGALAVVIVIIALLIIGGFIYYSATGSNSGTKNVNTAGSTLKVSGEENSIVPANQDAESAKEHTIEILSSGFSPSSLEINAGDSVTWVNKDSSEHWPASAMHPTHTVYPGSDIKKCGTAEQSKIFDACNGLSEGESWSFTFNEKGSWNYHDHLFSGRFGKIIVK